MIEVNVKVTETTKLIVRKEIIEPSESITDNKIIKEPGMYNPK